MRDRRWVRAQFAVAGALLALSLLGVIASLVFGAVELTFSFGGAIQAFAVFPGTVISLVVNALIMRTHRDAGLSGTEKVLLGIQFCVIFGLVVMHFVNDALGALIIAWPAHITLAIIVFVVALVRATTLRGEAAIASAIPSG